MNKLQKYSSYTDSGIEWLGEIPSHWKKIKLGYFFRAKKGLLATKLTKEYCETIKGVYNVYSGQTENEGVMASINTYEFNFEQEGCLFTTTVGAKAMTLKYLQEKFSLSQNCMIIIAISKQINNKFFFYHLQPLFSYERKQIPEYMQASFRMEDFYSFYAVLPPLKEQQKIASFLDNKVSKIDNTIKQKEKLIELLKEQKQIVINSAVTKGIDKNIELKDSGVEWIGKIPKHWEVRRLKYLFKIQKRIAGKLGYDVLSITQQGIKIKDVTSGEGQLSMDYSKYQLIYKNEFAMNHMDLLTGYVDISKYNGVISPDYRVFTLEDKNSLKEYFLYIFQMGYKNKIFYAYGQGVSMLGRWRFPSDNFYNFKMPVPPFKEQQQIVEYIEEKTKKIDNLIQLQEEYIKKLKEYKEVLINEVVTGKVKVCDG